MEAYDFIVHNDVFIAAEAAKIWPYILNPDGWRTSGIKLVSDSGEPGQVGERFKAVAAGQDEPIYYYVTNAELVPERRRTIRLDKTAGGLIGYASWVLTPVGDGTRVEYHVYCRDEDGSNAGGRDVTPDIIRREAHDRIGEGFADLKRLVEG